jgi:hypothetical protein
MFFWGMKPSPVACLSLGLEIRQIAIFDFKKLGFLAVKFLVIKIIDPYPHGPKYWIWIRARICIETNADQQHY